MTYNRLLQFFTLTFVIVVATRARPEQPAPPKADRVIAIDVLLLPDSTMVSKAVAANARLRSNYREGYSLGGKQATHITLVHRYVHEHKLPAIEKAITPILEKEVPTALSLKATGYANAIWGTLAITSIRIEESPDLSRLQKEIVKAVEPFAAKGGTADAFSTSRELPKIDKEIVNYVEKFVPETSGDFNPHVTIGVAHENFIERLRAMPFQEFTFMSDGVAIYQLGNFGTAQKNLWEWNPRQNTKK